MKQIEEITLLDRPFSWRRASTLVWMAIFGVIALAIWAWIVPWLVHYVLVGRIHLPMKLSVVRFGFDLLVALVAGVSLYQGVRSTVCFCKLLWFFASGKVDRQLITSERVEARLFLRWAQLSWSEIDAVKISARAFSAGYEVRILHRNVRNLNRPYLAVRIDDGMTEEEAAEFLRQLQRCVRPRPDIQVERLLQGYL
ncbi:MAG: hypothetical protein U0894_05105 [Pirellulales bacterium]